MDDNSLSDLFSSPSLPSCHYSDDSTIFNNNNRSITLPSLPSNEALDDGDLPMDLTLHNTELGYDSMFSSSSVDSPLDLNLSCDQNDFYSEVLDSYDKWLNEEEIYNQAWTSFIKNFPTPKNAEIVSASIVTKEIKKEESSENLQNIFDSLSDLFDQDEEEMKPLTVNYSGKCKSFIKQDAKNEVELGVNQEIKQELQEINFDIGTVLPSTSCGKASYNYNDYLNSLLSSDDEETRTPSTSSHISAKTATKRKTETKPKKPRAPPKRARRDITRIFSFGVLQKSTREAKKSEKNKRIRLAERKEVYEESNLELLHPGRVILDFDIATKEILAEIEPKFVPFLKKHQIDGIKFLFNSLVESIDLIENAENDEHTQSYGGILAHCMGLGKTFQVVAFLQSVFTNPRLRDKLKRVLLILPLNVMKNWENEFNIWHKACNIKRTFDLYELYSSADHSNRASRLEKWQREGGVMLITPKLFCQLLILDKYTESIRDTFMSCLLNPGPDMVIIDEGHCLKNIKSDLNQTTSQIRTLRRVILTGTPMQNNLDEYFTMVSFVKPYLLGDKEEFNNQFANPINNGQFSDSTPYDVYLMKKRFYILHKLLEFSTIHRRSYAILEPDLPPRYEYVLDCRLSSMQEDLYQYYLENYVFGNILGEFSAKKNLFLHFCILGYIWNHPALLLQYFNQSRDKLDKASLKKQQKEPESDDEGDGKTRKSALQSVSTIMDTWDKKCLPRLEDVFELELSAKFSLLFGILSECEKIGDKICVFSQSLLTLDLIEGFLNRKLVTHSNDPYKWYKGSDYFRIDGSVGSDERAKIIEHFNNPQNTRARLILISTRAGGVGINLVGANRAVIFDSSWNPANDVQAIYRIYRYGQKKEVFIYRFAAFGTMESKIYKRQIQKQSVALRVVDEFQIERHFKDKVLRELYDLSEEDEKRDPPVPPKEDKVLWEVFAKYRDMKEHPVVQYHNHDSLLENLPEEKLSAEERDAVWAEYLTAVDASTKPPPPQPSQSNINQPKVEEYPVLSSITNGNFSQAIDNNHILNDNKSVINMNTDHIYGATQPGYNNSIDNFEDFHVSELTDDQNNNFALVNSHQSVDYPQYSATAQTSNVECFPTPAYSKPPQQMMDMQPNNSLEPSKDDFFNALQQLEESSNITSNDAQVDGTFSTYFQQQNNFEAMMSLTSPYSENNTDITYNVNPHNQIITQNNFSPNSYVNPIHRSINGNHTFYPSFNGIGSRSNNAVFLDETMLNTCSYYSNYYS